MTPSGRDWGWAGAVALVTAWVFAPVIRNGFINWDDPRMIILNPQLDDWSWGSLRWMLTTFHFASYQPSGWLLLGLASSLGGKSPAAFHALSLTLHAANAGLFFLIVSRLLGPGARAAAAAAALLFSLHPLQVQAVAWASSGPSLAAAFWMLASFWAYGEFRQRKSRRWFWACAAAFAAGATSHWQALLLPVLLIAADWALWNRLPREGGRPFLEKWPFWLILVGAAALVACARLQVSHYGRVAAQPAVAASGAALILGALAIPGGFSFFHQLSAPDLRGTALILALTGAAAWAARRRPAVAAAWACTLAGLSPVLILSGDGPLEIQNHHAYAAVLPLFALLAGALGSLRTLALRRSALAATAALALILGRESRAQIRDWRSAESLWTRVLAENPGSDFARGWLGEYYLSLGKNDEAVAVYREQALLSPGRGRYNLSRALHNLAADLAAQGRLAGALAAQEEAARLDPSEPAIRDNLLKLRRATASPP